jgi:nucleotide-binding universal stress UspA family protein
MGQPFRILFATDGSDHAAAAGRFLAELPLLSGSRVEIVVVVPGCDQETAGVHHEELVQLAHRTGQAAKHNLPRPGVEVEVSVREGEAGHQILTAAQELGPDLVVVGSKGLTGLEQFLLGSVARNVAKYAARPVVVARQPRNELRTVILAVDESDHASKAGEFAVRLPLPGHTELLVCQVVRPYEPFPGLVPDDPAGFRREVEAVHGRLRRAAERRVEEVRGRLEAAGKRSACAVLEGDPAAEILKLAFERDADLIIAGARGVSLIQGLLVGSVADRLLKTARCSVLLVHV